MLLDLTGKKILVTGIANNRSIAWGIAQQLKAAGAELGITYLPDEKGRFEAKVRDLTAPLEPSLFLPLNVQDADQMAEVFGEIKEKWGVLDGLVHCLAFAGKEELIGDYSATTAEGFRPFPRHQRLLPGPPLRPCQAAVQREGRCDHPLVPRR